MGRSGVSCASKTVQLELRITCQDELNIGNLDNALQKTTKYRTLYISGTTTAKQENKKLNRVKNRFLITSSKEKVRKSSHCCLKLLSLRTINTETNSNCGSSLWKICLLFKFFFFFVKIFNLEYFFSS